MLTDGCFQNMLTNTFALVGIGQQMFDFFAYSLQGDLSGGHIKCFCLALCVGLTVFMKGRR